MTPPINEIDRLAAEWAVETDNENFSVERQATLTAWLESDPRHFGAYINARAALARIERLGAAAQSNGDRDNECAAPIDMFRSSRRRFILAGSIAAGLAVTVVAGTAWWANSYAASFETPVGQTRMASLPDNSTITLNTDTRAAVRYSAMERNIVLERGEALFDVAKNKLRPFVVRMNTIKVRAVGTSFSVGAAGSGPVRVMVREGVVEIDTHSSAPPVRVYAGSRATALPSGQLAIERLGAKQISEGLAWRSGHVFFRHQTLGAIATEFKRYSNIQIVIDDPAVASKTVTGMFVATDPVAFSHAVAASLNLNVEDRGNEIHITRK
ncbi:FecR family protein [Rhizomicrobium electricum]|uniref:FecR family protein n=1 Tax=Rhizomicrobium electricum TaxID=480070 RepID=A0ABP3PVG9_9PROT|nr:FecR domain-containing protein [Rhizomicrobium electricum]NIJ49111.1 transmembrane sensor [Rhizomicrobium electricum]